jgi:hypothetical protein
MPEPIDELADEVRYLRVVVERLVAQYEVPWTVVLAWTRRYESPLGRTSWWLTYRMALEEAVFGEPPKQTNVLSNLPIGE